MKRALCIGLAVILLGMLSVPVSLAESDSAINILLLGTDNLGYSQVGMDEEMSRADAIYIVNLHPNSNTIKLLSIERDYLVVLPDDLGENKLGTATYFGGPEMALDVINDMFNLDIKFYAHIDINNLITAIDKFGGVEIEIFPDEISEINEFIDGIRIGYDVASVFAGLNHLNGLQVWAFMGVRNQEIDPIESNALRNARQQRVLSAMMEQAIEREEGTLVSMITEILPLITTNISTAELLKLIKTFLSLKVDQIDYFRTPKGPYKMKRVNMHRVVVPDDMNSEIQLIHQFLSK